MNKRRRFSSEQKAMIVRRHLSGKEPVSDLADEFGVQPSQIHLWVKQVLEQAERAFSTGGRSRSAMESEAFSQFKKRAEVNAIPVSVPKPSSRSLVRGRAICRKR